MPADNDLRDALVEAIRSRLNVYAIALAGVSHAAPVHEIADACLAVIERWKVGEPKSPPTIVTMFGETKEYWRERIGDENFEGFDFDAAWSDMVLQYQMQQHFPMEGACKALSDRIKAVWRP